MKTRKVMLTVEVSTDLSIKELRTLWRLSFKGASGVIEKEGTPRIRTPLRGIIHQVQCNVVK